MSSIIQRALFLVFLLCSYSALADEPKLKVGDVPPDYLGMDVDGNEIRISDEAGKLVVVTFWASWCPPCLKELPVLDNIQTQLGPDAIRVVAVNFKEKKRKYLKIKKALKTASVTLTHDRRGSIGKKYGVSAIPHLFIIGKDGKLAFQKRGYGVGAIDTLVDEINALL
jgi:thiol-disulfide isomerase/thioredoxin